MPQEVKTHSFTARLNAGHASVLVSEIQIAPVSDPIAGEEVHPSKPYQAIWDTGATKTVISERVAEELKLIPVSVASVHGVHGKKECPGYIVNVVLPNHVGFVGVPVIGNGVLGKHDALIGMDIIGNGDFAISSENGNTLFSFRVPSVGVLDFVKEPSLGVPPLPRAGRNDPCPCGSGQKFKKCCGR